MKRKLDYNAIGLSVISLISGLLILKDLYYLLVKHYTFSWFGLITFIIIFVIHLYFSKLLKELYIEKENKRLFKEFMQKLKELD